MAKTIPLKCNVCGQTVGSIKVIEPLDQNTEMTEGEMVLEQHLPDCPVIEALTNKTLMSISIGSYSGSIIGEDATG